MRTEKAATETEQEIKIIMKLDLEDSSSSSPAYAKAARRNLHANGGAAAARMRVRQELYEPTLPIPPYPLPPAWPDEMRAMMTLWIARERRVFEMEMRELDQPVPLTPESSDLRISRLPEPVRIYPDYFLALRIQTSGPISVLV
ncbi:hypothetical protein EDD22DRAFT_853055 [Suillus occidentalis]|nr:hypothetical protein EDD22DRAFT_853055 [Suillus occidentalis]